MTQFVVVTGLPHGAAIVGPFDDEPSATGYANAARAKAPEGADINPDWRTIVVPLQPAA